MKSLIDLEAEDARRPLRRIVPVAGREAAATTAGIASPTRGATLESPRALADQRLREAGMFMGAGEPATGQWYNADSAARERLAGPYLTTHDKSLPNARRSQRGQGTCQPGPVLAVPSHDVASGAPPAFLTDSGFTTAAMHRRGRGRASPAPFRPTSNPNDAGAASGHGSAASVIGHGMASGSTKVDNLLGGRRARGLCSPRPAPATNLLAWGD
jgi:hypothetical protein